MPRREKIPRRAGKFSRLGYRAIVAVTGFVMMLNAVPAWAGCRAGEQIMENGECWLHGKPTGRVVCDADCKAQRQRHAALDACLANCLSVQEHPTDAKEIGRSIAHGNWHAYCRKQCNDPRRDDNF